MLTDYVNMEQMKNANDSFQPHFAHLYVARKFWSWSKDLFDMHAKVRQDAIMEIFGLFPRELMK